MDLQIDMKKKFYIDGICLKKLNKGVALKIDILGDLDSTYPTLLILFIASFSFSIEAAYDNRIHPGA